KEFVREWLIANNFMGKEGQIVPEMSDAWIETISERYIELFNKVTGTTFAKESDDDKALFQKINEALSKIQ
ncbi:MAG: phosphoribosylaminoimidazolesuccinocarboxamide synthase, partial [Ferruginibacter sp.]